MHSAARPTVAHVAAAARVSTATVSRVLNRPGTVRPLLRARVEAAVARLGYVPHAGARALSLNRSGTVGVVVPTLDNAIFAKAVSALQGRLAEHGYQLLIASSEYDPEAEARQALTLVARGVDALALCGGGQSAALLQRLDQRGLPHVHVGIRPLAKALAAVGFDNGAAVAQAVRYLHDLGHRRIAMLAGITRHNDRATARVAGVRRTLAGLGLSLAAERLVERKYDIAAARDGFRTLMAARSRPTAVVCGNDVLAFGALLEAERLGLAVPAAVSIVGFDDLELTRHVRPALTTVHVPTAEMWRAAADYLVAALAGERVERQTSVDVGLVVRESTGPVARR